MSGVASAQSGHFITGGGNSPTCTVSGLQLLCTGKVAGLGGTTFEIVVDAEGTVTGSCINPQKNPAGSTPGQASYDFDAQGTTGTLPTPRNGQFTFSVPTDAPVITNPCPNPDKWDFVITGITFTWFSVSLYEDDTLVDTWP